MEEPGHHTQCFIITMGQKTRSDTVVHPTTLLLMLSSTLPHQAATFSKKRKEPSNDRRSLTAELSDACSSCRAGDDRTLSFTVWSETWLQADDNVTLQQPDV